MPISPEVEKWLKDSGYKYHCFISWPHTINSDVNRFARKIKREIEEELALYITDPKVFLDESELSGGAEWESDMFNSLCKSVAMVSICTPIYYHPDRNWCGLEWAAMQELGDKRIPASLGFKTIIPVIVRKGTSVPEVISRIKPIDISGASLRNTYFYNSINYGNLLTQIVNRIGQIANTLQQNRSIANCEKFESPGASAFLNHPTKAAHSFFNP